MKSSVKTILAKIRSKAHRRAGSAQSRAMGRQRRFHAFDLGEDTFVFEDGVWTGLDQHASVLLVQKRDLVRGRHGHLMTVTTGNHSVAALPLLGGQFWDLARVAPAKRGETLFNCILCANVVNGKLEVSQRDIPVKLLVTLDNWLVHKLGFGINDVVMSDRNEQTLDHYRRLGQEWRVKQLAWTDDEMRVALNASKKRISAGINYYHNARGVHLFTYPEFHRFAERAVTDFDAFRNDLRELVSVYEGNETSFMRQPKFRGHHEIELFGVRRGVAIETIVPELEKLMESIVLLRTDAKAAAERIADIDHQYLGLLSSAEFSDEESKKFVATLYMYLTGEIYSVNGEGTTPAFDDRRTALPGATFSNGRPTFHPGSDSRSEVLLSNLRGLMSKDEVIEYANVYELRNEDSVQCEIGKGKTREIVYKTNRRPLPQSMIEKCISRPTKDYGSYVIARVEAFKALGISLGEYRLLRRRHEERRLQDFYIRTRCEGEPLSDIPDTYFQLSGEFGGSDAGEDPQVLSAFASLLGDAAAQNMAMKKYDAATQSPLFGIGKEIYQFEYDINAGRLMPKTVACCSVRGSFGWPCLDYTDENLRSLARFYLGAYAEVLRKFAEAHPTVPLTQLAADFFDGFEFRTRAMEWTFTVLRDDFESFDPHLPSRYHFGEKWKFVMWSLERQVRRIISLKRIFLDKLHGIEEDFDEQRINPDIGQDEPIVLNFE